MKRIRICIAVLALAGAAIADGPLSVSALLKNADKHDSREVFVKGKVSKFDQKTSRAGNKYYTLVLKEGEEVLNVYSRGELKPPVKAGDTVEVRGVFRKEKKLRDFTVKNEVDATEMKDKNYGVKKVD